MVITHIGTGRWLNDFVKRGIGVNGLHVLAEYVNLLVTIPTSGAVVVKVRPVWRKQTYSTHTHTHTLASYSALCDSGNKLSGKLMDCIECEIAVGGGLLPSWRD